MTSDVTRYRARVSMRDMRLRLAGVGVTGIGRG
jgi:hypothetical protein